jgi:hypothetical protein
MTSLRFQILITLLLLGATIGLQSLTRRSFGSLLSGIAANNILWTGSARAYERRDVGGDDRSMITAAFNEQAFKTNNRLEAEGFKLDTREEEAKKLSDAMKSFSYDSSTTSSSSNRKAVSNNRSSPNKSTNR